MGNLHKLSATRVKSESKMGRYGDGGGLYLNVTETGTKSWIFRYMKHGKASTLGIGAYPDTSLAEARELAAELRKQIRAGNNPAIERKAVAIAVRAEHANAVTFDHCAEKYIATHAPSWKNPKHCDQWRNTLKTYASPTIGALDVRKINTDHITQILETIWHKIPESAGRLRGRIESILDWATVKGHRTGDNPARWKGHLEMLLSAPNRKARIKHFPALPYDQMNMFMPQLQQQEGIAARAVEFAILTAARSGEVRGAKWEEFDLDAGLWTVPASRMKAKKDHRVTLSARAIKVIKDMKKIKRGDLIFFGRAGKGGEEDKQLSDMSLSSVLKRMDGDNLSAGGKGWIDTTSGKRITVHGFRSSFRDWVSEETNYPGEMAEMALAHTVSDAVEAAYRRGDLLKKRIKMMQDWAGYCSGKKEKPAAAH